MKELSIEQNAKAYDGNYKVYIELINRLEGVKDAIKKQNYGIAMDILCKPYPEFQITTSTELKESEDERIRKALIKLVKKAGEGYENVIDGVSIENAISWLEKQGNLMKALQISNAKIGELIEKNYYLKEQLEKQSEQKMKTPEESLGIDSDTYNKIVDECVYGEQKPIKEHNACEFCEDRYGCVNPCSIKLVEEEKFTDKVEPKFKVGDKIYLKPEYRMPDDDTPIANTVFEIRAIDDKHYRFDGSYIFIEDQDKYELVEQKHDWGEEDIELLDNTIKFIEDRVAATSPSLRTYSPTLTGKEIPFLKALKDRVQPKQEWSEENEEMLNSIVARLHSHPNVDLEEYSKEYNWLNYTIKSIKDRVLPQPKQEWKQENTGDLTDFENAMMHIGDSFFGENAGLNPNDTNVVKEQANFLLGLAQSKEWSEEDERMCKAIIDNIQAICEEGYFVGNIDSGELIEWLKSLRPQSQWKPSDEQMDALEDAIADAVSSIQKNMLNSLYQDLKKLKQ